MGQLEAEILSALWSIDEPATPARVREELNDEVAYTTVTTILGRLCVKGVVERHPLDRGFTYQPKVSQAELTARRMLDELQHAENRQAALAQFVGTLSKRDEKALRDLLRSSEAE
jgi:predicted transcriptional regulator